MHPRSHSLADALLDVIPFGVNIVDEDGTILFLSTRQERELGSDAVGRKCWEVYRDDQTQCDECPLRNGVASSQTAVLVSEGVLGGRTFQISHTGITYEGKRAVLEVFEDVTESQERASALRLTQFAVDRAADAAFWITEDARFFYVNDAACDALDYSRDELLAMSVTDIDPNFPPERWPEVWDDLRRDRSLTFESIHLAKDGRQIPVEIVANFVEFGGREYNIAFARNVTQRRREEDELRETGRLLVEAQRVAQLGWYRYAVDSGTWTSSSLLDEIFGIAGHDFGKDVEGWLSLIHPEERDGMAAYFSEEVLGKRRRFNRKYRIVRLSDGAERWVHGLGKLLIDENGQITEMVGTIQDVTEQVSAEEALRRSEADYRGLVAHATYGIYRSNPDGRFLSVNPALVEILGYASQDELLAADLAQDIYVDSTEREQLLAQLEGAERFEGVETQWRRKDGTAITVRLSGRLVRDPHGRLESIETIAEDVTGHRELERQLQQAQKMEAIGELTSGIAHDFNNLLSVILLNTQLAVDALDAEEPVERSDLEGIEDAAKKASVMSTDLLGFSRRADLAPVPTDLAKVVAGLSSMLRRFLPEDIQIAIAAEQPVAAVRADPRAVEQMLLNLATNARDAMPSGGKLRIGVQQTTLDDTYVFENLGARPGDHVCISVADSGSGMSEETRRHVFEPFYTTKPTGKGTGLGLAMVYGLTKQQGGFVDIASELGRGTEVHIYFPAVADVPRPLPERLSKEHVRGGRETILLVEDADPLRAAARRVLERHGYTVLTAVDGADALERYRAHRDEIDIVVSDLVMPRMSGRELYDALREESGPVKFVLVSGYGGREAAERGALDSAIPLVQKPWELAELLVTVRRTLDA